MSVSFCAAVNSNGIESTIARLQFQTESNQSRIGRNEFAQRNLHWSVYGSMLGLHWKNGGIQSKTKGDGYGRKSKRLSEHCKIKSVYRQRIKRILFAI